MTSRIRKIALTAHITSSVGWLGAVAGFESLAVAGLVSRDALMVRAAYLAMEQIASFVIVPFACTSLITGLVMSLGTKWGLFRHYWVLAKFLINTVAIILLLLHTRLIGAVAKAAAEGTIFTSDLGRTRIQLVAVAGGALLALVVATVLAVFKPRGMTPYGRQKQHVNRRVALSEVPTPQRSLGLSDRTSGRRLLVRALVVVIGTLIVAFVALHLTGGHGNHGH